MLVDRCERPVILSDGCDSSRTLKEASRSNVIQSMIDRVAGQDLWARSSASWSAITCRRGRAHLRGRNNINITIGKSAS